MLKTRSSGALLLIFGVAALASCTEDAPAPPSGGGSSAGAAGDNVVAGSPSGGSASGSGGSATGGGGGSATGGGAGAAAAGAGAGGSSGVAGAAGGTANPCSGALFCETFDDYADVTTIANQQKLGPWRAALNDGATMNLEGTHKTSGTNALHVHIDGGVEAGGRLFADGQQPLFANEPTHLYGRMMMYIDPNGTSIHWTFFGVNGDSEPAAPTAGRNASYIISSLPKQNVNTYSFVYGLEPEGDDAFHDCSSQSSTSMPSTWACVAFELDSVARKLRLYKDGAPDPILSVDDHGKGCVPPTNVSDPWYGPAVTQLFVGAWSFHTMNAPLDVWIDDLVVDTKPVNCQAP